MKTKEKLPEVPEVIVTGEGLFHLWVCSSIPPSKAIGRLEHEVPRAGVGDGWHIVSPPVPCEKYKGRWHYTLLC